MALVLQYVGELTSVRSGWKAAHGLHTHLLEPKQALLLGPGRITSRALKQPSICYTSAASCPFCSNGSQTLHPHLCTTLFSGQHATKVKSCRW